MTSDLAPLIQLATTQGLALGIVFLRIGAMIFALPGFGERALPMRVRLAAAFAFCTILTPMLPPVVDADLSLILTESLTGLFFGLLLRFFVYALQIAGTIAAQSTSLSQMFGGTQLEAQPIMSALLFWAGLALAMASGLHLVAVEYMLFSYDVQPVGHFIDAENMAQMGVQTVARCFALGFALAGPFLIAAMIYNVTLGFINKAMPQLMVSFVGAPAVTLGGLLLLAAASPLLLDHWRSAFWAFATNPVAIP